MYLRPLDTFFQYPSSTRTCLLHPSQCASSRLTEYVIKGRSYEVACLALALEFFSQRNESYVSMNPPCRGNCPLAAAGGRATLGLYLDRNNDAGYGCLFDVRGTLCAAGSFCPGGGPAADCPPGSFCAAGSSAPEPCPREGACGRCVLALLRALHAHLLNLTLQREYLARLLVLRAVPAQQTAWQGHFVLQGPSWKRIGECRGPPHVAALPELLASVLQPRGILLRDAGGQNSLRRWFFWRFAWTI